MRPDEHETRMNPHAPGQASARLRRCLEAIERWNPQVNALMALDVDGALRQAAHADAAAAAGGSLGLLHGCAVLVKDNIDTAGLRTTSGSTFFEDRVPAADAHVVARLRGAGAMILGKATMHEFAFGVRSHNPVSGQCRNPWDTTRIPGGSSGGSAVAVATGMATYALGTDTGGSVRIPAALTGITGLRPTFGRVSNAGTFPVSVTHDTVGPMARSAHEAALLYVVIAGHDPRDPHSERRALDASLARLHEGIAGMRIGRPRHHYFDALEPAVAAALDAAIGTLGDLGATLVDIELPDAEDAHAWATTMIYCDACDLHAARIAQGAQGWGEQTLERLRMGLRYSGTDYARAMRARERWCATLARAFERVDLIVSPTCPTVAPPIAEDRNLFEATRAVSRNTYAGAFGRLPGISVPCGRSPGGLPIGMQLEAAPWHEHLLLRAGVAFQSVTDWHRRWPCVPAS